MYIWLDNEQNKERNLCINFNDIKCRHNENIQVNTDDDENHKEKQYSMVQKNLTGYRWG